MAEKIINNPSLLPDDLPSLLDIQLSGNNIIAISGHPVAGSGGGTQSDFVYYPVFDDTTGNVEFHLGTTASNPQPAGGWHISGATGPQGIQGEQGIQGIPGVDGKNPVFEIDSNNAHWKWKYAEATSGWTDLGIAASGSVGPKGEDGDDGTDGISPTVSTSVIPSGNRVTFTYGEGSSTYIDVMSGTPGTPGTPGTDGFSPTVTTSEISPTTQHPQGGTSVTITDAVGAHQFDVWNGTNGQGATVNLLDGDGIHITNDGTNYTIGVSANYSAMAVTWVQDQHYLTDIPNTYALKTDVEAASANALTEAKSWVNLQNFATQTWVGNQGYLTSVPDSYATKTYANDASANALSEAKTWVGQRGYLTQSDLAGYATETYVETASANAYDKAVAQIPDVTGFIKKDVDDLIYYYKKTETSSTSQLSTEFANKVNKPDTSLTDKYLVLRTDTNGAASGWCDYNDKIYSKSESDNRYMQKNTDSTLSGNGTTNNLLGINTTNMAANKQYAFTTNGWAEVSVPTIPDITANNGLSANGHTVGISTTNIDANKQYAWTTTGWQLVSVPTIPDITAHNGLSANGHTVGIDDTNLVADTQYVWTTNGWAEVDGYLPTSGGTVSGQLVVSATQNTFDDNYIKCINNGNVGYSRFGVGSYGGAVIKAVDGSSNPVQVNVRYNANNNELIQVQKSNADVGYLIPAMVEQAGWTPSADDKILHIVLES